VRDRRSRAPDEARARQIAAVLYPDLDRLDWIPSDDTDVFRLTFTSGREPRVLKVAVPGNPAVWRELGAFPAMRRLGIVGWAPAGLSRTRLEELRTWWTHGIGGQRRRRHDGTLPGVGDLIRLE
jgi:hypothetical protein